MLDNFLVSIYSGALSVSYDGNELSSDNLDEFVSKYGSDGTKAYYQTLTSDETQIFEFDQIEGLNPKEVQLFVLKQANGYRRVLMTRASGMKIYERGNFNRGLQFTAVLRATGKKVNQILKKMEDPTHTKWSADTVPDSKNGELFLKTLNSFIRDSIKEAMAVESIEEIEAVGVSEFLPFELSDVDEGRMQDTLPTKLEKVERVRTLSKPNSNVGSSKGKKKKARHSEEGDNGDLFGGAKAPDEFTGGVDTDSGDGTNTNGGTVQTGQSATPSNRESGFGVQPNMNRPLVADKDWFISTGDGKATYKFQMDSRVQKYVLEFNVVGESSRNQRLPLLSASVNGSEMKVHKNQVLINREDSKKGEMQSVDIVFDSVDSLGVEVKIYEAKV